MMDKNLMAFIHDDITWCADSSCNVINCMRNTANMMDRTGLHSYANFRETDECPIYRLELDITTEEYEK